MTKRQNFTSFLLSVMEKLLAGNDDTLLHLRKQLEHARFDKVEFTGVGFYTDIVVDDSVSKVSIPNPFRIGDVVGILNNGVMVGFVLFINDGYLDILEGYTFGTERWPEHINDVKLFYESGKERDLTKVRAQWN